MSATLCIADIIPIDTAMLLGFVRTGRVRSFYSLSKHELTNLALVIQII